MTVLPVVLADPGPPRPPLVRPRYDRMVGGVAHGVATHLGVPVPAVRLAFLVSIPASGFVLYLWLWALVRAAPEPAAGGEGIGYREQFRAMWTWIQDAVHLRPSATQAPPAPPYPPAPGMPVRPAAPPAGWVPGPPGAPAASATPPGGPASPPAPAIPGAPATPGVPAMPAMPAMPGVPAAPAAPGVPGVPAPPAMPLRAGPPGTPQPPPAGLLRPPAPHAAAASPAAGIAESAPAASPPLRLRHRGDVIAGALLVLAGALLLASREGWAARPGLVIPLLVVGAGAIVAYAQLDEVDRARWAARTGMSGTRYAVLRVIGGLALVIVGVLLLVVQEADVGELGRTLLAAIAVLAGAVLVLAPWAVRLWRDLDVEREARIRESARADIAAHLHDSVLQTLALIQRRSHDAGEVSRLARAQERDLRGWLYGGASTDPSTLAARVAEIAAEVEDLHGVVVEVVTVGDRPVGDDGSRALLAALCEAVLNAARHAHAPMQVYVECGPSGVEAFVKDRGVGFDLSSVPDDRLGIRESIIGRMERHGGSARVRSVPGDGTEVRLLLPDEERPGPRGSAPESPAAGSVAVSVEVPGAGASNPQQERRKETP